MSNPNRPHSTEQQQRVLKKLLQVDECILQLCLDTWDSDVAARADALKQTLTNLTDRPVDITVVLLEQIYAALIRILWQ